MNTYAVYHRKTTFDFDRFQTDPSPTRASLERSGNPFLKLHWPEDYRLVATVEAENLEEVFARTQYIDHEWWQNPGVELLAKSRSTSVSDVIIGPDRHVMVVMGMGFTDLSVEIGHHILDEAEEAFGLRSLLLERAASGHQPRPASVPDFLFWLESEARLQADHLYDDILFFDQHESYVRTLFGLVMELRAWGFTPALPPSATFILANSQGDCQLLPAEQPQTFPNLLDAANAWLDLVQDAQLAPELNYLVSVPPQVVAAALERIQATQSQPLEV
ncbi:MAG: hypothetical protein JW862_07450 [Anaerolineales bacterium]|nr:hypothetical protein [Anaerolineales bacterium]